MTAASCAIRACDRRGMGVDGTAHPARQVSQRQTDGDHARGGERSYVRSVDRLSVARNPERRCRRKARSTTILILWTYDSGILRRIHHALYEQNVVNERNGKPVRLPPSSIAKNVKAPKRGPASMRRVTTPQNQGQEAACFRRYIGLYSRCCPSCQRPEILRSSHSRHGDPVWDVSLSSKAVR